MLYRASLVRALCCGVLCALVAQVASAGETKSPAAALYEKEWPSIGYARAPVANPIARLQERLQSGEAQLQFRAPHGYLESLLKALDIDPSSQVLVYSRTSLQVGSIQAASPRAIYFNEETYVAWVQDSGQLELGTMDRELGQVFYILQNSETKAVRFQRQMDTCLSCHDTYSLSGGGVPRFLLMSSYVDTHGELLTHEGSILTSDETELRYRWGGWYVTGRHGSQVHLGNLQVHSVQELVNLDRVRRGNLDSLSGLFDTRPYLSDKSDIVALLVLQHQVTVQELITRVNYEVRSALAHATQTARSTRAGEGATILSPKAQQDLDGIIEPLVRAMLFVDAAGFSEPISGNSGFDRWFQARGPRDPLGRSLRDLDLRTRLFRYPLSYLVYSPGFQSLPLYAKEFVYRRFHEILGGHEQSKDFAHLTTDDRTAILQILTATDPEFAQSRGTGRTGP
jgi:hypothetical protein